MLLSLRDGILVDMTGGRFWPLGERISECSTTGRPQSKHRVRHGKRMAQRIEDLGKFGGAERDRTAGLLVANEALSQLSYSPTSDSLILPVIPLREKRQEPASEGAGWRNRGPGLAAESQSDIEWLGRLEWGGE
jgi:hypothetical protein